MHSINSNDPRPCGIHISMCLFVLFIALLFALLSLNSLRPVSNSLKLLKKKAGRCSARSHFFCLILHLLSLIWFRMLLLFSPIMVISCRKGRVKIYFVFVVCFCIVYYYTETRKVRKRLVIWHVNFFFFIA